MERKPNNAARIDALAARLDELPAELRRQLVDELRGQLVDELRQLVASAVADHGARLDELRRLVDDLTRPEAPAAPEQT